VASAATPTAVYTLGTAGQEVHINSILLVNRSTTTTIEVTAWSCPDNQANLDSNIIVPSVLIPPRGVVQGVPSKVLAHVNPDPLVGVGARIFVECDTASSLTVVITGAVFT
jgi:hypothetical protein